MAGTLHDDAIVIDGLIIANFSREVFLDMRRGGLTAANCTCSIWEGIRGSLDNIVRWQRLFRDNDDLILPVRKAADIEQAKRESKTGIILGWQNLSGIEDRIGYLEVFKTLGVGVMQIAYNTQNLVGSGCYETHDGGLSDFGRAVIDEMNRVGIVCDLSHVGARTSEEVIRHSRRPVAYTHVLPAGLKAHPRNKSDAELRFIAERGGFIGVTMFPPFLARGTAATVEDYVAAIDYVGNVASWERIGIGTDFTQDQGPGFFEYICRDKGEGRLVVEFGEIVNPAGLRTIGEFPNLTAAMEKSGWPEARIRGVIGGNWLRFLAEAWGG